MNADLEEQLKELGSEYRAVVSRLRMAKTVELGIKGQVPRSRSTADWLIAASLLIVLCLVINFQTFKHSNTRTPPAYGAHEYYLSVNEMIATQRPDGGWQNDFLTRRNAEALSRCEGREARVAYKKALRNLRSKGVL